MYNQTIAKLLAKEDITIQHGNYHTAWFDVQNRILGLPLWKDMGKDVYDLLIGHEVGHALYTPFDGWHDSPEKLEGAPRSYLNVIEDARIERFVQRDYPGLVGPFKRGYQGLVRNQGFFSGLDSIEWDQVKLIDKINIKAKLGNTVTVPFSIEEYEFYKRAMATETFEEVVQLCRDILTYTQENTPELLKQPEPEPGLDIPEGMKEVEQEAQPPMGHDDYLPEEEENSSSNDGESGEEDPSAEDETSSSSESGDGDESDDRKEDNYTSSESDDDDTPSMEGSPQDSKKGKDGIDDESETDVANRAIEEDLIDTDDRGRQVQFMTEPRPELRKKVIISYKQLAKARKEKIQEVFDTYPGGRLQDSLEFHRKNLKPYLKQVTRSANYAVKEFEMRKAAYQWQRAQTAKSGSLDVNLVHSYKYNEDIFARVTQLANAKNHGMIMFIDYSGSMSTTLGQVIDQLIHLVVFCKKVNIPFDVYAFTTNNHIPPEEIRDGEIDVRDMHLTQLISSTLGKKDYLGALEGLYIRKMANESGWDYDEEGFISEYDITPREEEYGSTPLSQALVLGHRMIREFRAKHGIDKMNLIVLSDGDSNGLRCKRDYSRNQENIASIQTHAANLLVDKKILKLENTGYRATQQLLQNISKRYNCQTLGFFVSDSSHDWTRKLFQSGFHYNDRPRVNKEYRKHKCVTVQNAVGYDEFYMVKGGSALSTQEDSFEVDSDASKAKLRTAFKKFATSKKNNKTLLTNFGKKVA